MGPTAESLLEDPPIENFTEDDPVITIHVGTGSPPDSRTFQLAKSLLASSSGYFAAALSGRFLEAEENVCRLPEEDTVVFQMFAHWAEHGTLYESTLGPEVLLSYQIIAQLYVFADAHAVSALQNTALDIFAGKISFTKEPISRDCGMYILDHTLGSSPLRGLMVEIVKQACGWSAMNLPCLSESFGVIVDLLPGDRTSNTATSTGAAGGVQMKWRAVGVSSYFLRSLHVAEEGRPRR